MHFIRSVHHHRILITRRTPAVKLYVVLVSMRPVDVQVVCRDVERLKTTPREELHECKTHHRFVPVLFFHLYKLVHYALVNTKRGHKVSNVASQNKKLRPEKCLQGQTLLCSQRRYPLLAIRKNAYFICSHLNCIALKFNSSDANIFISTDSLRSQVGTWPLVFSCVHTSLVCKSIFILKKRKKTLTSK